MLAIAGVLFGMGLTGQKFSIIMTGTGVVALAGIVVNNAIVLTDTFNRLREEGVTDVRQAVLKTAAQRLRTDPADHHHHHPRPSCRWRHR